MKAQVTKAHKALVFRIRANMEPVGHYEDTATCAQLIADSEAAAVAGQNAVIAEWLNRAATVSAERDQLRVEVRKLQEQIGQQLAACDCAATMDTPETHEQNKTVTRENPFWSNAFGSVMRRTFECIALRAEAEKAKGYIALQVARAERAEAEVEQLRADDHTETERAEFLWKDRAERAESELAAIKRGHGEIGRYEQLRLKNAELSAELAKERVKVLVLSDALKAIRPLTIGVIRSGAEYSRTHKSERFETEETRLIDAALKAAS